MTRHAMNWQEKQAQVWACLQGVTDPELDESVTELNFVTSADVDAENRVHIAFRLPTYWCAANFSFLMADDMRQAVGALGWVKSVSVVLGEHMYADKINAGLAQGLTFQETFGEEAGGSLDELRRTFLIKAFQRRQVALISHLAAAGYSAEAIAVMTAGDLERLPLDDGGMRLVARYLERRGVPGPVGPDVAAFVTGEGATLRSDGLHAYAAGLRRVGVNAEFNSALCRGLLAVRFDMETPLPPRAKPSSQPQPSA